MNRFLDLVKKFADVIDNAHVATVAHPFGGNWTILGTVVTIGGPAGPEITLEVPKKLLALSRKISLEQATSLIDSAVQTLKLRVGNTPLHLLGPTSFRLERRTERLYFYTVHYEPGPYSAALLSITGASTDEIVGRGHPEWQDLDEALEQFDPPYLGLQDLAESQLGYPLGQSYSSMIYASLLIPVKILEADIGKEGSLQLKLRRDPRIGTKDVAFGVVMKREGGVPTRASLLLSDGEVTQSGDGWEKVRLDLPTIGYSTAVIQLRVRNEILSSTRLYPGVSSPRLRTHRILDPDGALLEKALTKTGGVPFEQAVAMLLHLSGFKVETTSLLEKLASSRFADILAFSSDEQTVLVGACVFTNPSPQDVTLLAQSLLTVKETLDNSAGLQLAPVIFTSMSEKTLSQLLGESAQRENIRIVAREGLLRILALVRTGAGSGEIMQIIQQGYLWPWQT